MNRAHFTITTEYPWASNIHKRFKVWFLEGGYDIPLRDHVERSDLWDDFFYWCKDQYGEPGVRWEFQNSTDYRNYVCFMDEADATIFRLRWC